MVKDRALVFSCNGDALIGILSEPADVTVKRRAVLLIVGGPQYRVGSHRQFCHLARFLAAAGYPVFRFDYRGMGDSAGDVRSFESVHEDIACAADALLAASPKVRELVIWGLCDGASAALMFAANDTRLSGLVLLNPWVRSESSLARTHLSHYYGARLLQRDFWTRLIGGELSISKAIASLVQDTKAALGPVATSMAASKADFVRTMLSGLERFPGPVLLVLSGKDLTASEFDDLSRGDPRWSRALSRPTVTQVRVADADHTFSAAAWRHEVEQATLSWLASW